MRPHDGQQDGTTFRRGPLDDILCRRPARIVLASLLPLDCAREGGIFVVPALGRSLVDAIETLTTDRTQRWTSNRTDDGATSF